MVFDLLFRFIHGLSLVEVLKVAACRVFRTQPSRRVANVVIDVFMFAKWVAVLAAWVFGWKHPIFVLLQFYLLAMNLETYFWHHLWDVSSASHAAFEPERERRRFINLCSAIAYSIVVYAYAYHRVFDDHFTWRSDVARWAASLKFSVGNALTGATGDLTPTSTLSTLITTSQLAMTVVFVSVLLSNSIPRTR